MFRRAFENDSHFSRHLDGLFYGGEPAFGGKICASEE